MKRLVDINKNQLDEYLSDFNPKIVDGIKKKFIDINFNVGPSVFKGIMKKIIKMPQIGKKNLNYWISRGWDKYEAEEKRTKIKKDPSSSPMNINFWMNRGYSKEESIFKIKSQRKMNVEYWISRGYSEEESIEEVKLFQRESSSKLKVLYDTDLEYRRRWRENCNTCIEYWLKRGYTLEESTKEIKNRQKTFSKDICIEKYGEKLGTEIWEERQLKWQNSLKESEYNGIDGKISKSVEVIMEKYGDNWIDKFIDITTFKDKECIRKSISYDRYEDMVDYYISQNMTIFDMKNKFRSKLIQEFYQVGYDEMYSYLVNSYGKIKKARFGNIRYINGHICRSDGEYDLSLFLIKNNINYIYEKKYPNLINICDFYLSDYDIYIEYNGMNGIKDNRYDKKKEMCVDNNIKHFMSNNIQDIKNYINDIISKSKNT